MNINKPFVSVIIPVLNDSVRLKSCLEALSNQTYPKSSYEVIVVDNGSDEDINGLVSRFEGAIPAYEGAPGPAAARNKGITLAKGEIIAFTDSDCSPLNDWIEKGVESILSVPGCGMVAGKVEFDFRDPANPTIYELYDSIVYFQQKLYIETRRFGGTGNLFTLRSVIDDVGMFDDKIFKEPAGEDVDWGHRVFLAGYKQGYSDNICVRHPARYSFKDTHKKIMRITKGRALCKSKQTVSRHFQGALFTASYKFKWLADRISYVHLNRGLKGKKTRLLLISLLLTFIETWEAVKLSMLKYKKV